MSKKQSYSDLTIFIVGLGSMGRRRIRNMQALGVRSVYGFDLQASRREQANKEYRIETFGDFNEGIAKNPDAVIISTPPDWHVPYGVKALAARKPFFMEASVVSDGMSELARGCADAHLLGVPSCTMRFFPGPKKIRHILESGAIGKSLGFTYHVGMYLPDWHPWEDYRTYYVGKRETGAAREIVPFELEWLSSIFGEVDSLVGTKTNSGSLKIDIDDLYQVLLNFKTGCSGHLMVDVLDRDPVRFLRVVGSEGSLEWRMQDHAVRVYHGSSKTWETLSLAAGTAEAQYVSPEEPYVEEMTLFLNAVMGQGVFPYTLKEDIGILQMLKACEDSADKGTLVKLHEL